MKLVLILAAALALSACGTTQIERPHTSQAQMQRDIQKCEYEGLTAAPYNALIARQITARCLRLKGYRF